MQIFCFVFSIYLLTWETAGSVFINLVKISPKLLRVMAVSWYALGESFCSGMDIPMFHFPYRCGAEYNSKQAYRNKKRQHFTGHGIFGFVGIHSEKHQAVGPEEIRSFAVQYSAENASYQTNSNRNGKTPYFHREKKLKSAYGKRSHSTPEKPEKNIRRE